MTTTDTPTDKERQLQREADRYLWIFVGGIFGALAVCMLLAAILG